jgi:hypothetical protein
VLLSARLHDFYSSCFPKSLLANPYFIFYPHLALTLLIHPTNHTVLKIILHSNLPGEVNFGRTGKSPWLINTFEGESRSSSDSFTRIKEIWSSTGEGDEAAMILDRAVEGGEGLKGDRSLTGQSELLAISPVCNALMPREMIVRNPRLSRDRIRGDEIKLYRNIVVVLMVLFTASCIFVLFPVAGLIL